MSKWGLDRVEIDAQPTDRTLLCVVVIPNAAPRLCFSTRCGAELASSVLQCVTVAVCCSVWPCVAVCCHVLQCVAVCCSVLPCVAVCLQCVCSVLQCVAVCFNVMQCGASVLQCVAVCCSALPCVQVLHA